MRKQSVSFWMLLPLFLAAGMLFCVCPPCSVAATDVPPGVEATRSELHSLSVPAIVWTAVGDGLELGLAELAESKAKGSGAVFVILRVDPEKHAFALQMASEAGKSMSLPDWSLAGNLRAGINASMYLPDNLTSTGYMRSGDKLNNTTIGGRLGAFFVAEPLRPGIRNAAILEHDKPGWRDTIKQYGIVVQNYRLINSLGRVLWPDGGAEHSTAVVADDSKGRILFMLSQEPLTPQRFARYLQSFSLGLATVMYVEGGAQAGIFVRLDGADGSMPGFFAGARAVPVSGGVVHVWKGRQNLLNIQGNPHAVLPNIIGIRR